MLLIQPDIHQEGIHQEGIHQEGIHQEGIHQEGIHQEGIHQEGIHQESIHQESIKYFELNGRSVKVTHHVDKKFYGEYSGRKDGYLILKENGTGEYLYDLTMESEDCGYGPIFFEWGFLLDENNEIVRFKRDYGLSFPVILRCTGKPCFQLCRKDFLVDYILEKNDILTVSSSDDWIKNGY